MKKEDVRRELLRQEMLADTTKYCCYCGQEKVHFGCCGENHFETFAEMSQQEQESILDQMWEGENK